MCDNCLDAINPNDLCPSCKEELERWMDECSCCKQKLSSSLSLSPSYKAWATRQMDEEISWLHANQPRFVRGRPIG